MTEIQNTDETYMREALKQAKKALALGEVPIGCVIVHEGKIIARGYNRRNTDQSTLCLLYTSRLAGNSSEKLLAVVEETAAFLMEGNLDYEFRTTVVRELHEQEDFVAIRDWLAGARRYYLQAYRDSAHILKPGNYSSYSREELERFAAILREKIPVVEVRGIE